jgi:hypothetical protein
LQRRTAGKPPLAAGGEGQRGAKFVAAQIRELAQDIILAHPGSQSVEDVSDGDPQAANARLAGALGLARW